jgi:predicted DNA binding CopG/RHH family protein
MSIPPRNYFSKLSSRQEKQLGNISKEKILMTKLDPEEQEILESYENDEWISRATSERIAEFQTYAKATLAKDKKITLRLSSLDLEAIQAKVIEEGIPYQTLISSILHKSTSIDRSEHGGAAVTSLAARLLQREFDDPHPPNLPLPKGEGGATSHQGF